MAAEKYTRATDSLEKNGTCTMKVFGNSMMPLIKTASVLVFIKEANYEVGDVVLTRVKSRWIDAHKITRIDAEGRYLIANNKGFENGWTKKVFGRVISVNGQPFGRPITTKAPGSI